MKNPLNHIDIKILSEESLGVRSMATYIETPDLSIILDPGVSLAPRRFGLPPHPLEFQSVKKAREKIMKFVPKADIVFISHYHLDHYTPPFKSWFEWCNEEIFEQVYSDKQILIKNPDEKINFRQRRRALTLVNHLEEIQNIDIKVADGRKYKFLSTDIEISMPMPHGAKESKLGWVLLLTIKYREETVVYAPDVQGPISEETLQYIISMKPDVAIVGGPPLYLAGNKVKTEDVVQGINNLELLVENVPLTVVSHHLLRQLEWREHIKTVFLRASRKGNQVLSAAEFMGTKEEMLEAMRKQLYEEKPPSKKFMEWIKNKEQYRSSPPPL